MQRHLINREIIRHIMGNLGISLPPELGIVGITTKEFLQKEKLTIEYQTEKVNYPLWFGSCLLGEDRLYALATDIVEDDTHEFCLIVHYASGKTFGFKHVYVDSDFGTFLRSDAPAQWKEVALAEKLMVCSAFERMADIGVMWEPERSDNERYKILYLYLVSLIEY
jgi:hypothetical protein